MEQPRRPGGRRCPGSAGEAGAMVPAGNISRKRCAPPGSTEQELSSHEMSARRALDVTGASGATMEPRPRQPPPLNADLVLEIIARSDDVATFVRCAAASKSLRRVILDPGFRRRLELRAAANGGFDPALVVSYRVREFRRGTLSDTVVVLPSRRLRFDTNLLRSFEPASARNGLLVLHRNQEGSGVELRIYNTVTGHVTSLPTMDDVGLGGPARTIFPPALLSIDGAGHSFELLVMYKLTGMYLQLETHTFSSQKAKWSAAPKILCAPGVQRFMKVTSTAQAIIGRSIHWLCITSPDPQFDGFDLVILALHTKTVQATVIKLPQECLTNMGSSRGGSSSLAQCLILAATTEGKRLSIVVAEKLVISVWTLLPEEGSSSWSRQVVIRRREIDRQLTTGLDAYQPIRFDMFGESSGTVLFWMQSVGLVQLNLGTKKALVLWRCSDLDSIKKAQAFLHEIDLVPFLQCMKLF